MIDDSAARSTTSGATDPWADVPDKRDPWDLIPIAVLQKRLDLGLTQQEAADRAGVSLSTWNLLETGNQRRFRPLTLAAIAKALRWTPDSFQRMEDGFAPRPIAAEEIEDTTFLTGERGIGKSVQFAAALSGKIERLSNEDRETVERLVDRLLGEG